MTMNIDHLWTILFRVGIATLICIIILKIVGRTFKAAIRKKNSIHLHFAHSIVSMFVIVICVYSCLSTFEFTKDISKTLLQSGTLIIAIATFAAQQALGNVISGFSLSMSHPFEVGHKIKVLNGGTVIAEGIVTTITLRHTEIKQFDGQVCIVPNSAMDAAVVINTNFMENVGNYFEVEIGYDADVKLAKEIMLEIYRQEPLALKKQEASILTSRMTANGLILKMTVWTKTVSDNFTVCSNMREKLNSAYREKGITIPYQTITIDGAKEA